MQAEDFIRSYEAALSSQNWDNVSPLMHEHVAVTFSNGVVNEGKPAVKKAFEYNFSIIKNEEFEVKNVRWLIKEERIAVYLFDFYWKGIINGKEVSGNGIGTSTLVKEGDSWKLLAEHLGKKV